MTAPPTSTQLAAPLAAPGVSQANTPAAPASASAPAPAAPAAAADQSDKPVAASDAPVTELRGAGYDERTRKNVEDSDGTLIVTFGHASGGTAYTIEACEKLARPHLIVDGASVALEEAVRRVVRFVREHSIRELNVAGPRASGEPRAGEYAYALVRALCLESRASQVRGDPSRPSSA